MISRIRRLVCAFRGHPIIQNDDPVGVIRIAYACRCKAKRTGLAAVNRFPEFPEAA